MQAAIQVEMFAEQIQNLDRRQGVTYVDDGVACGVEELVLKRARENGWYAMSHV